MLRDRKTFDSTARMLRDNVCEYFNVYEDFADHAHRNHG